MSTRPMIQVFKPSLGEEELDALREIFRSGWVGLGPKTAEFERAVAAYVGAPHAVALNSATAALHLACAALGIGPGDEVLVPTITFVSTAHAPGYVGARPIFVDVDPQTLAIDLNDARRRLTPRTRAIMPVHYGGHPCDMNAVWAFAAEHNLLVIEDAAHAMGADYDGKRIGNVDRSDAVCFSFQAVKNLCVGDGGMITFKRPELLPTINRMRWCGIDKSTWDRTESILADQAEGTRRYANYGWYYEIHELGHKYHMNDIAAAIGLVQLGKLDAMNARRREIAQAYDRAFAGAGWITTPAEPTHGRSAWHNYVIRTPQRDALNLFLKERSIATGVHYMPIHLQPYYRKQARISLPVAERVWTELLTLPLYPGLTDEEVDYVCESVLSFAEQTQNTRAAA